MQKGMAMAYGTLNSWVTGHGFMSSATISTLTALMLGIIIMSKWMRWAGHVV
jgi:hypothetical protein